MCYIQKHKHTKKVCGKVVSKEKNLWIKLKSTEDTTLKKNVTLLKNT